MAKNGINDEAQVVIAAVLRYGSIVSTAVMALGIALAAFIRGEPRMSPQTLTLGSLIMKAFEFDPLAVTQVGILLLLMTPVFRILVAIAAFAFERDLRYLLISSGVLLIVLGSIAFAAR